MSALLLLAAATAACPAKPTDQADAAAVISGFYAAIERGDIAAAQALTTPDFHAIDVGKQFTGPGLIAMVGGALEKGVKFRFMLEGMEAHVACDVAWLDWRNEGAINGTPTSWLESAVLRRTAKGWRMAYYHSTKLAPATP